WPLGPRLRPRPDIHTNDSDWPVGPRLRPRTDIHANDDSPLMKMENGIPIYDDTELVMPPEEEERFRKDPENYSLIKVPVHGEDFLAMFINTPLIRIFEVKDVYPIRTKDRKQLYHELSGRAWPPPAAKNPLDVRHNDPAAIAKYCAS